MKQHDAETRAYFYELQPGDATRYEFFWMRIPENYSTMDLDENNVPDGEWYDERHMFSGWGRDTYVLGLCRADRTNVAFPSKYLIEHWRDLSAWRFDEIAAQLGSTVYTAKVLIAALSVLIRDPEETPLACQAMMEARVSLLG